MTERNQSPVMLIHKMSQGHYLSQALYAIAKLGVADFIGEGRSSVAELARVAEADEKVLYRVMRALAGFGVLHEEEGRFFSLTPAGQLLRSDHPQSLRHAVIFRCEENYDAFRALVHAVRNGENAFKHVFGAPRFEYLKSNKEATASFQQGMKAITKAATAAILKAYDFSPFKTVVDVGGGNGALLAGILEQTPHLSAILFDQAETIELARAGFGGTLGNCQLIAGDFFDAVPKGGDVYILKSIIHDWSDEPAVTILRNCRAAMEEKGKLLVIDRMIGPPNQESYALFVDLAVLVEHGGQERRQDEFEALFNRAGLKLLRVIETESTFYILDAAVA
ncbi:MAG TPA: methyltransferase [Candidatus Binatia bacterium]|nr:methyltransferase [Candidatus Binatia bacterium]